MQTQTPISQQPTFTPTKRGLPAWATILIIGAFLAVMIYGLSVHALLGSLTGDSNGSGDVRISTCGPDSAGLMTAGLDVANHGNKVASYIIELAFTNQGVQEGAATATVASLEPGQTAHPTAAANTHGTFGACKIVSVTKF